MSWELLERTVFRLPYAPPRVRKEPMQVLCVGFPRTGTESLQQALITLGYDYTYHGWDILFEQPLYSDKWVNLARRKFKVCTSDKSILDGDCKITAAEFDEVLGHCTAVTDAAGSVFAAELIEAYPDAKVILNIRRDEDAWYQSVCKTLVGEMNPMLYIMSWFCTEMFWAWHVYWRFLWACQFRAPDGDSRRGICGNGRWIYREHNNMIRGLVPKEKLLEWSVEDGWHPLCKFLGKEVPVEEFPHANTQSGFKGRIDHLMKLWVRKSIRNMMVTLAVVASGGAAIYKLSKAA
ncbi:unnamed protein product [Clonostachys solani]|uniref:P-loop containing nucleoside triphosphate hydrolase protein n=1 Tax=Clonostachys solani TaxID=160281 RepID=A0A9N9YZA0_9HYPO|nr:unnamed protein product [Clonostachys solani]